LSVEELPLNFELFLLLQKLRHPALDELFRYLSLLGSGWAVLPLAVWTYFYRRRKLLPLLTALLLETLAVTALKSLIHAPRPPVYFPELEPLFNLRWRSFPSGDAAMAFTVACVMAEGESRKVKLLWCLYALTVAFGRVYAGVHFPLDVAAGALLGVTIGKLTIYLYNKRGR